MMNCKLTGFGITLPLIEGAILPADTGMPQPVDYAISQGEECKHRQPENIHTVCSIVLCATVL